MFEEFFSGIEISDCEMFYLAEELKLQQVIGLGVDYESMNQEDKTELKQTAYELLEKHNAIQMDFSGNTNINSDYADVMKKFEFPNNCTIFQHIDLVKKETSLRKVYLNNDEWVGLDYFDDGICDVYNLGDLEATNKFIFLDVCIDASGETKESIEFSSMEELQEKTVEIAILSSYIMQDEYYAVTTLIFSKLEDGVWYVTDSQDDNRVNLSPVTELIRI